MNSLDLLLEQSRFANYSDVHIDETGRVLIRLDGQLMPFPRKQYTAEETKEMLEILMANENKQPLKEKRDLDFVYVENGLRYRVNVYRNQGYLSAACRVINENIKTLEQLNLPPVLKSFTQAPHGLVLLTGPTGSGKSTTLAAMIDEINHTRPCHILTIEDPVEYLYHEDKALIHQREIGHDVDSFATALRSAMREDPDVVLVGEMRDFETIQATITLAETGHLVFSTLHTIGAAKTIDRILPEFKALWNIRNYEKGIERFSKIMMPLLFITSTKVINELSEATVSLLKRPALSAKALRLACLLPPLIMAPASA